MMKAENTENAGNTETARSTENMRNTENMRTTETARSTENVENPLAEQAEGKEYLVVEKLIKNKYRISFAESCTGGMAAARLINVPDASKVIDASVVTYANEAKVKYASVSEKTIEEYGVVSEQVAGEMATGIALNNGANVGVGISGIAGPGGATATKPVGMVCFGFYINGTLKTFTKYFGNPGRNIVRGMSVDFVYSTLIDLL